jgi:F0F1-type ATP synthase alpha subunit
MSINPSEVTKLLKDQIKNFGEKAEVSEIGKVLSVGDGIARVYGLIMFKLEKWLNLKMVLKVWHLT